MTITAQDAAARVEAIRAAQGIRPDAKPPTLAPVIRAATAAITHRVHRAEAAQAETDRRAAERKRLGYLPAGDFPLRARNFLLANPDPAWHDPARVARMAEVLASRGTVVLIGHYGPGKTTLATWLARQTGKPCLYRTAACLYGDWTHAVYKLGTCSEHEWLRANAKAYTTLVVDEWERRPEPDDLESKPSQFYSRLFNSRYESCVSTIVISNLTRAAMAGTVHDRIRERWLETGEVFDLSKWPNHRAEGSPL